MKQMKHKMVSKWVFLNEKKYCVVIITKCMVI